jgi:hypothetical protein
VPVVIVSKTEYAGTVTPSALNVETVVVDIPAQADTYIVEGWLDLSAMASGDVVVVCEYVAVDGVNLRRYACITYSGVQSDPVIRFHSKQLLGGMLYRVTVRQTAGVLRSFPYGFLLEVLGSV